MSTQMAWFEGVARQALAEYGLEGAALTCIRHSDSVTFRVEAAPSDGYLLRLHVPITTAMGTHGADAAAVNSELLWLEALCRDTDLVLQRPARNRDGELVTTVSAAAGEVNCSLLSWLGGQPYHRDLECEDTARQIGRTVATLHRHAGEWQVPPGFRRPERDVAYFEGVLRALWPAVEDARIGRQDYAALEGSVALLIDMMGSLSHDRSKHGIMHADGHKGNMLLDAGEMRLIDFSFCAFGNYVFDLGICLSDMNPAPHGAFFDGYRSLRPLPDGWARLAEGFFLGAMVGTFSFWVPRPEARRHLERTVPRIVREYAQRFNQGEPFWPYE